MPRYIYNSIILTLRYIIDDVYQDNTNTMEAVDLILDVDLVFGIPCTKPHGLAFAILQITTAMNVRDWLQSAICRVLRDLERFIKIASQRLPNFVYAV